MPLQSEIEMQLDRAGKGVPWVARSLREGRVPTFDEVPSKEILHGHAILLIELTRVVLRLAGEIDKLNGHDVPDGS